MADFTRFSAAFLALFLFQNASAQLEPVRRLPALDSLEMEGEAVLFSPKYEVTVGGRLCHKDPEVEACNFSSDLIVLERATQKAWAVPLANLPDGVAEHFSAVGLGATCDGEMAFLVGGYGFDGRLEEFRTLGQMTYFPIEKTVEKLLAGQSADLDFRIVLDDRMAVFDAFLMKVGDYFLLFNGQRAEPFWQDEIDRPFIDHQKFDGELRTWRLDCLRKGFCEVAEFQVCAGALNHINCLPKRYRADQKDSADGLGGDPDHR